MKNILSKTSLLACMVMVACATGHLRAQTPAYTTTGTETDLAGYGISGVEFTLNMNINVTDLGFTPIALGGGDAPQVTVWQVGAGGVLTQLYTTGNIISSITFPTASPGTGSGAFTYVPVSSPLLLSAGDTYLVTAPAYWAATYNSSGVTPAGGGVFSSTSFVTGSGWSGWGNTSYVGASPNISSFSLSPSTATPAEANFEFTVAETAVPEPSSYALLGAGVAFLALLLGRRRAQVLL